MDIPGAIREFFGWAREREENVGIRELQRIIKRQDRAIDAAERYIVADEHLKTHDNPKEVAALKKEKSRQKSRFRKFN